MLKTVLPLRKSTNIIWFPYNCINAFVSHLTNADIFSVPLFKVDKFILALSLLCHKSISVNVGNLFVAVSYPELFEIVKFGDEVTN